MHSVARLHYVQDMSQVDIARKMGLSTATISRLLRRARDEGIVRIEVPDLVAPDDLAFALRNRLGLRAVKVVDAPPLALPEALAAPLGALLLEIAPQPGSAIAIGWGRAVRAVLASGLPEIPGLHVVPATGGLQQQEAHFQINEFTRLAAEQLRGTPHFLHAPNLAAAGMRDLFLSDPAIAASVALWDRLEVAILGIGGAPSVTPAEASVATDAEARLTGVCGDVIRHYFDAEGRVIYWEGEGRMIAASPDQLARTPYAIGIACGQTKAPAIIGAARGRLISALVTDAATASAILELLPA